MDVLLKPLLDGTLPSASISLQAGVSLSECLAKPRDDSPMGVERSKQKSSYSWTSMKRPSEVKVYYVNDE